MGVDECQGRYICANNHAARWRMTIHSDTQQYWDELADTFDDEPDHGLRKHDVREAWRSLLGEWLGTRQADVLDMGCGTGSLSLLLSQLGHRVTGVDWSPAMIARAKAKTAAAGRPAPFFVMDATKPAFTAGCFDVVLCRHVSWAVSDLARVLQSWARLLVPGGRLVLIEGYWHTGGGLHSGEIVKALPPLMAEVQVRELSKYPHLWGKAVDDERYGILARLP